MNFKAQAISWISTVLIAFTLVSCSTPRPPTGPPQQGTTPTPKHLPPVGRVADSELDKAKGLLVQYHPASAAYLGGGVNATDLTDVKDRPVVLTPLKRIGWDGGPLIRIPRVTDGFQADTGARQVKFKAELTRTREDLYRSLNISMSAEADSWFGGGSMSMDVGASKSFSADSFKLVIKAECDYGRYALESIALTPEAQRIATDSDLFYKRYGTHVAIMEDRFAEMAAIITVQAKDEKSALSLRMAMEGDIDLVVASGSFKQSMSAETKNAMVGTSATVEFYAVGGEGVQRLDNLLNVISAVGPNDVPALLEKAREGVKSYLTNFTGDTAPARMYWCLPLAPLRRSDPKVQDLQDVLARRERASEGIIELQQIVDNGLGIKNSNSPDSDAYKRIVGADLAARERAEDMLRFFRRTFIMSRGEFAKGASNRVAELQSSFVHQRKIMAAATGKNGLVEMRANATWELDYYEEWQLWMDGVTEFPFVEKARGVAAGRRTFDLDAELQRLKNF